MTPTRRAVLLAAAAMGAASASTAPQTFQRQRRLLMDSELVGLPPPAGAQVIPVGVFLDPDLLAASPAGDYEARLNPANRFLLLEALRHERIPHVVTEDVVLFRKPSAKIV